MIKCCFCNIPTDKINNCKFNVCNKCGLYINIPMSQEEILNKNRNFLLSACKKDPFNNARIDEALDVQMKTLIEFSGIKNGKVFDVGAASGFFMYAAKLCGWEADGNEISEAAIKWAKSNYNIDIRYGFVEYLDLPNDYYDAVVLWNTLEHTYNPKITLMKCRDILKFNGLLYIKVPNKITINELNTFYERVHLYEFTTNCLHNNLAKLGFKKIFIKIVETARPGLLAAVYLYRKGN